MTKVYTLDQITYGFDRESRKWHFNAGPNTLITVCKGGKTNADLIAKQVNAAFKRTKGKLLDGISRKKIDEIQSPVTVD